MYFNCSMILLRFTKKSRGSRKAILINRRKAERGLTMYKFIFLIPLFVLLIYELFSPNSFDNMLNSAIRKGKIDIYTKEKRKRK